MECLLSLFGKGMELKVTGINHRRLSTFIYGQQVCIDLSSCATWLFYFSDPDEHLTYCLNVTAPGLQKLSTQYHAIQIALNFAANTRKKKGSQLRHLHRLHTERSRHCHFKGNFSYLPAFVLALKHTLVKNSGCQCSIFYGLFINNKKINLKNPLIATPSTFGSPQRSAL